MLQQPNRLGGGFVPEQKEYVYIPGVGFPPAPKVAPQIIALKRTAILLGTSLLFYLIISMLLPVVLYGLAQRFMYRLMVGGVVSSGISLEFVSELISTVCYLVQFLVPFCVYCAVMHMPSAVAFPSRIPDSSIALPAVPIALGVSVIAGTSVGVVQQVFQQFGVVPVAPDYAPPGNMAAFVLYAVQLAVFAPLVEEFVFRGAIMQSLRQFGDTFALVISSLIFAMLHMNMVQFPYAFLMGLTIGYFVLRTSSIWTGIFIHMANNGISLVFTIVDPVLDDSTYILLYYILNAILLLAALLCAVFMLRSHRNMFTMSKQGSVIQEKIKYRVFLLCVPMLAVIVLCGYYILQNFQKV